MAQVVRELSGNPSQVLDSLAERLVQDGWTVTERTGPLLRAARERHCLAVTALGSTHGTLVCAEGSRRAVTYLRRMVASEGAVTLARFSLTQRWHILRAVAVVGLSLPVLAGLFLLAAFCQSPPSSSVGSTTRVAPAPVIASPAPALQQPTPALPQAAAPSPAHLVRQFYALLDRQDFATAYSLLSRGFQGSHPFQAWRAGYDSTRSIRIDEVREVSGRPAVQVVLTATDLIGGRLAVRRYVGEWQLVREVGQWRLDRGLVRVQP